MVRLLYLPPCFDKCGKPFGHRGNFATENLLARLRARQLAIPSKIAAIVAAAGTISEIENITEDAIR
jgi:hypothetical protein